MTGQPETGLPPWESSDYRAKMLRDLKWAREAAVRWLDNESLHDVHAWYSAKMATGHCGVPVTGRIEKERRRGRTNRLGWRWVVYTKIYVLGGDAHEREDAVCYCRQDAVQTKGRAIAQRWAEYCRSPAGRLEAHDALVR